MKISTITVRYGELRSTGYPQFSNKRIEVELTANLEPGDVPSVAKNRLLATAHQIVESEFGGNNVESAMEVPF